MLGGDAMPYTCVALALSDGRAAQLVEDKCLGARFSRGFAWFVIPSVYIYNTRCQRSSAGFRYCAGDFVYVTYLRVVDCCCWEFFPFVRAGNGDSTIVYIPI